MSKESFLIRLNQLDSSYLVLLCVAGIVIAVAIVIWTGLLDWVMLGLGHVVRRSIRRGFLLWERFFSALSCPAFAAIILGLLAVGGTTAGILPGLTIVCALATLFMGLTACLAYMFIDLERYQVERGYKAVYNPLKGQELALYLVRYGQKVGVPLLATAAAGMIGGFALLNQGFYETIGTAWYSVAQGQAQPGFEDFLAYALIHLLRIVDLLNLAGSNHLVEVTYVHKAAWPASVLLAAFQIFFTFVLLEQIFASIRQGNLLTETITDFWSPHESIHERARHALPQYGARAIWPLLVSLRAVSSLTKEQRDQLPPILAAIGPAAIPALVHYLHDSHEHMRAIAAAALGHLHARDQVVLLVPLAEDPSDVVRQSVVEALGTIGAASGDHTHRLRGRVLRLPLTGNHCWFGWKRGNVPSPPRDPIDLVVSTLQNALADRSAAVRTQAARALGCIGAPAMGLAYSLFPLLKDADETVRCEAAEALGKVGARNGATVHALVALLEDASPAVKTSAARALGSLKKVAASAVAALVPLLQDQDQSVRTAAAEAIAQAGPLNGVATDRLVEGLASADNVVRAQTAESLGTIGAPTQETAAALVEAVADSNDGVRAKAVQALGKIGEGVALVAVPSLVRALRDQDNWVSALAAEALGDMGDAADEAIPGLIRALRHMNPQVRCNAAEALGKMAAADSRQNFSLADGAGHNEVIRRSLNSACSDPDGGVRSQAIRALGMLGSPVAASREAVLAGLQDADPQVRAAAVEALGQWGVATDAAMSGLIPLLEDANDQVKVQVAHVLPKLAGATPAVIDGLCRQLLKDDSVLVQFHAAQALSTLGPSAAAAGKPLLRAAQTMEVTVREQAMRAIAMIQPPEAGAAFASGLKDADGEIRKMASAGWMKAAAIPEDVIPALIEALRDPEIQVRANAAHALARLDAVPAAAVSLLIDCTTDANDGLRINAALALKLAKGTAVAQAMEQLVEDVNSRIRFIAASWLLATDLGHCQACAVVMETLSDPTVRLRQAALALVQSLGACDIFLVALRQRAVQEEEPELREALTNLVKKLDDQVPSEAMTLAG